MLSEYRPKLTIEITERQKTRLNQLLNTHGIRRAVISVILDDLLNMIETHGNVVVGVILDGAVKPNEIIPSMARARRRGELE